MSEPALTPNLLCYGREDPLPEQIPLRAGPLSMIYESGDLRYIRLGEREIVRRVCVAVRDHNWGTVLPRLVDVKRDIRRDSFHIRFRAEHRQGGIDFFWLGVIHGAPDGTVRFQMEGEARSTFRRNRIGFCVLHPMALAGQPCTVQHVDGSRTEGVFPRYIAPHQPFRRIRAITHEVLPGLRAEVLLEGDVFEMEDQRNWTDASFKTYCTPLELPFPVTVEAGTRVSQAVTLRLVGSAPPAGEPPTGPLVFRLSEGGAAPLPRIGLGVASHGQPLSAKEIARLRALRLAHLRVDLRLSQPQDVEVTLRRAAEEARALGVALEAALHVSDGAAGELRAFRRLLGAIRPPVAVWLVFHERENSTAGRWVVLARQHLADYDPAASFGAGTNAYFAQLNRERPPVHLLDVVAYSINPQVHAFDNASLVETLAGQAATLESARQFCGSARLAVSPVTLRPRFNPSATDPPAEPGAEALPPQVDPRQMSLFGAGWTAGSIKYLAAQGAHGVTCYETTGWRGVMETEQGSPLPGRFRSIPGAVFPLYHVLADVGAFVGGQVLPGRSSNPLAVDGLVLRRGDARCILLANFTPQARQVLLPDVSGVVAVRSLNAGNAVQAMRDPEGFRLEAGRQVRAGAQGVELEMPPFALLRVDIHAAG